MTQKYIAWFDEIDKDDIATVGGKGANLGEMTQAGFPVPYGFVVTSRAYFDVIEHNFLRERIGALLSFVNFNNQAELSQVSATIQELIRKAEVPKIMIHAISVAYGQLLMLEQKRLKKSGTSLDLLRLAFGSGSNPLVAVRSSATAEDLPGASFAGQQETYLNVKGDAHLLHKIRDCWASLFTERAIYYRNENKFDHLKVGLASVVQRMVQSDVSGIAFSIDPVTNNKTYVTIEAIFGLGEYIVQGKVTPDHYEVLKKDFSILNKQVKRQNIAYVKRGVSNIETHVPDKFANSQKLTDDQITTLAKTVTNIEKHYFFPQDIEWAFEKGRLYIVQSRPITTTGDYASSYTNDVKNNLIVKGDPASPGVGVGKPVVVRRLSDMDKVKKGTVLVASMTDPDFVPAMKRASAIVTEKGGRTSHAAIVSRELGLPAVVGATDAIKLLSNQSIISVNGQTGEIFKGSVKISATTSGVETQLRSNKRLKTLTKVYVNLAEVDRAKEVSKMDVDGVGLLRAEFMIADIGTHPKEFIRTNTESIFVDKLASKLKVFAKCFNPRPIIYRATDFKTNEYRNLKGGKLYEQQEENPMLGYRGAARYIVDRQVFKMELLAIQKVRNEGYRNLHLMIPFVRSPNELVEIKQMLENIGLPQSPSFKLFIMVEIPSVALTLDRYIALGIDGVSIGTNDLTMLTLGVDRDNAEVAELYKETDPAVVYLLEKIVKTARRAGVSVSVCGQAASDFADLRTRLIQLGVTSLSVNIDSIDRSRSDIYETEKLLWQKSKK